MDKSKISKRLVAIFAVVVFLFNISMASVFIIEKSHHQCSGTNCQVCSQLQNANNTITGSKVEKTAITFTALVIIFALFCAFSEIMPSAPYTLTDLKVKLTA